MIKRAFKKLAAIQRLKRHGANLNDLVDIFVKEVRSILEFGVRVWNSRLTQEEVLGIESISTHFLER